MQFSGKRLEFCVACERKLPEGSRIDRKYCSAACIERAYYQRHPDKKHVPGPRRPTTARMEAGSSLWKDDEATRRTQRDAASSGAPKLSATSAEQTSERQTALSPPRSSLSGDRTQSLALQAAHRQNADLQLKLNAALAREARIKEELADLQARHSRSSRALAGALPRAKGTSAKKKEKIAASERIQDNACGKTEPLRPVAAATAPAVLGPPPAVQEVRSPQSSAAPNHPQGATTFASDKPAAGKEVRPAQQSERHSEQACSPPTAQRVGLRSREYVQIIAIAQTALGKVPAQLRRDQGRDAAQKMSRYLDELSKANVLAPLSLALVRRILSTDPAERETAQQKATLARSVLADAIDELAQDEHAQAAELGLRMAGGSWVLMSLAEALVSICQGKRLKSG